MKTIYTHYTHLQIYIRTYLHEMCSYNYYETKKVRRSTVKTFSLSQYRNKGRLSNVSNIYYERLHSIVTIIKRKEQACFTRCH